MQVWVCSSLLFLAHTSSLLCIGVVLLVPYAFEHPGDFLIRFFRCGTFPSSPALTPECFLLLQVWYCSYPNFWFADVLQLRWCDCNTVVALPLAPRCHSSGMAVNTGVLLLSCCRCSVACYVMVYFLYITLTNGRSSFGVQWCVLRSLVIVSQEEADANYLNIVWWSSIGRHGWPGLSLVQSLILRIFVDNRWALQYITIIIIFFFFIY